jgi:histone H3/H4
LGQLWATLPAEEKQVYQQRAAEERSRVQVELQARQAAGLPEAPSAAAMPQDPAALIFPLNRMRKICKLDPDVRGLSKEALALVTKAAELALAKLGTESVRVAQMQNRRKLLPEDVVMVCQTRSAFSFLKEDLADVVAATLPTAAVTKKKTNLPSQANKLTSYFTSK